MMELFNYYNHLGFHNPYFFLENGKLLIESDFETALNLNGNSERTLDFTALVEVFSTGFCFSDRTLIKGLKKTPWMAKPNYEATDWEYCNVPLHYENKVEKEIVVDTFYSLLEKELLNYIKPYKNIGILLTGGMDSRIVAGILHNLQEDGKIESKEVFAYTWGSENSRDVVYARQIANLYNWRWENLIVDAKQMEENCDLGIENGCEFTPIHLHAMPQIATQNHLHCVLAGSFGDSVGRAEFSGVNVSNLGSLSHKIGNIGGVLRNDFKNLLNKEIESDLDRYHKLFPQKKLYQQYEQDQQLHYMRRMLNACMSVINKKIPLFQMFSSPEVFGFMWSLDPETRDNSIYYKLLKKYSPELLKVPWARTGMSYYETDGSKPDQYLKKHHDYGKMIRTHFLPYIDSAISDNLGQAKYLFDVNTLRKLLKNVRDYPINGGIVFEDRLLYVGQILNFIKKYDVEIDLPYKKPVFFSAIESDVYYKAKYFYKKIK